MFWELAKEDAW